MSGKRATQPHPGGGAAGRPSPLSPLPSPPHWRTLAGLQRAVVRCHKCPRLREHCERVALIKRRQFKEHDYWGKPVPGFGDPDARLLIVGLAPAAHGANRTGRMFTGDSSGDWLYGALHRYGFASQPTSAAQTDGLELRECYITAAARCAPPQNRPSSTELANCRPFLTAELALHRRIEVVIVLGRIAHESWSRAAGWHDRLSPRDRPPFGHGSEAVLPDGTVLLSSYHPSRQNTNTGRLTRRMWHAVFRRARDLLTRGRSGR